MRTTEDAVRSLKRYLALVLGQGPAPLAAAKLYPDPDAADVSSVVEDDVLYDHDDGGALVTIGLASAAAAASAGLVRATVAGRRRFWVCPPGTAWSVSGAHTVDVDDPFAWSPGLVRGCVGVTPSDWAIVLAADRWGTVLELVAGSGRRYRCAMLAAAPALAAPTSPTTPGGYAAQATEINVWQTALGASITVAPDDAPVAYDLIVSRADFDAFAAYPLVDDSFGHALESSDLAYDAGWKRTHILNVLAPDWTPELAALLAAYGGPGTPTPTLGDYWARGSSDIDDYPAQTLLPGAPVDGGSWPHGACTPNFPGFLPWDYTVGPTSPTSDYGPDGYLGDGSSTAGALVPPRDPVAADALPAADDWDVRFFHDEGEFEYPVCVVKTVGAPTLVSNQNWYELTQAYAVYAYPTPPPSATGTPSEAHVKAERVRQLFVDAFAAARADGARPMRVPLYDYEGLDANLPAAHREQADFMRVVGASVDLQPEPGDPRQTVVVADLRLNWRVPVGDAPGRGIVRSVELTTTET